MLSGSCWALTASALRINANGSSSSRGSADWSTPSAGLFNDAEDPRDFMARKARQNLRTEGRNRPGVPLAVQVKIEELGEDWPTATARDWKDGDCRDADVPTKGLLGRAVVREPKAAPGPLNPEWVEQLMGFPDDWTHLDGPAAEAYRSTHGKRRGRRKASSSVASG